MSEYVVFATGSRVPLEKAKKMVRGHKCTTIKRCPRCKKLHLVSIEYEHYRIHCPEGLIRIRKPRERR